MKVPTAPEFVLMLTEQDVTIPDAVAVYEDVRTSDFGHLGFKDVGADADALRHLTSRAHEDGRRVLLELADTSFEGQRRGYDLARSLGVDSVVGTWDPHVADSFADAGSLNYWPFVGQMAGSPLELVSDADELEHLAVEIAAHPATAGMVLMPYRQQRVEPTSLLESVTEASTRPVLVAGGVSRADQIADLADVGVWGFTMGSAVLKDRHDDPTSVARAIDVAVASARGAVPAKPKGR